MAKSTDDMKKNLLEEQKKAASAAASSNNKYIPQQEGNGQPNPGGEPSAPPAGYMYDPHNRPAFPKTAFIDQLTTMHDHLIEANQEQGTIAQPIPGAAERVQAMRDMRFRPDIEYAEKNRDNHANNVNPDSRYYSQNGVRFLKPKAGDLTRFAQSDFSSESRVEVIEQRGFIKSILRAISMLIQSITVLGGIRLASKTKQILPGQFGYAMNFEGNIEIYPDSPDRRIAISPWTNIKVADLNAPYVNIHNRIHLVNVPEGKFALATKDRHPVFLPAGRHFIESIDFQLKLNTDGTPDFKGKNVPVIQNGDSYMIRVPQGHVAHGDIGGKTVILEPEFSDYDKQHGTGQGAYVFHDPNFKLGVHTFVANDSKTLVNTHFQPTGNELVTLGPVRVLTVASTHAHVTQRNGELEIYGTGRHAMVDAQHVYKGEEFNLTQTKLNVAKHEIFISADGVQLTVDADLLFQVTDVKLCMKRVGVSDYKDNIKARTVAVLRQLIKGSNYLQPQEFDHVQTQPSASKEVVPHDPNTAKAQLLSTLGSSLQTALAKKLNAESGIKLDGVLITNLMPASERLRNEIESQATTIATAQRQITEAEMQKDIQRTQAETATIADKIKAENAARVLAIQTKSQAEATKVTATAEAEAAANVKRITADAELHIVKRTAEVNAAAMVTEAEARQKAGEMEAQTFAKYKGFGEQMLLARQMGDNMNKAFDGAHINMVTPGAEGAVGAMLLPSMGNFVQRMTAVPPAAAVVEHQPVQASRNT